MEQITDGVHRFDASGTNFYVMEGDAGLTLVDAGCPGHWRMFATWLFRTGSAPREIKAVLLTHNHPDHLGFADRAQQQGAELHIHADDLDGLAHAGDGGMPDRYRRNAWRPKIAGRILSWARAGITQTPVLSDVHPCTDGDRLKVPGNPRVVHVPGHTPGSAAYVFDDHDVICVGDALATLDPATGRNGISILPAGLNADDEQALASLDRLVGESTSFVLPGHGEPYHDGIASAVHAARAIGAHW
jgi:glyoxylase-like metal-dependent hydrolase (beta-lactamase superfamily II)